MSYEEALSLHTSIQEVRDDELEIYGGPLIHILEVRVPNWNPKKWARKLRSKNIYLGSIYTPEKIASLLKPCRSRRHKLALAADNGPMTGFSVFKDLECEDLHLVHFQHFLTFALRFHGLLEKYDQIMCPFVAFNDDNLNLVNPVFMKNRDGEPIITTALRSHRYSGKAAFLGQARPEL